MCDEITERENEEFLRKNGLTRRGFAKMGAGVAFSGVLPVAANAQDVTEHHVTVSTPDGDAEAYFVHPSTGKHPAVIVWPDVLGIRPAFRLMGKRLAQSGYSVLVVNPYHRTAKGDVVSIGASYADPEVRAALTPHRTSLSPKTCVTDGKAYVEYLDKQESVDSTRQIGVTGYCMTGSYTIRIAAAVPERIGAGASFHGGGLVTNAADSPHQLISDTDAGFLIAIAENDDAKAPETKNVLRKSFDAADIAAEIDVYQGALHGWCPPDSRVYNEAQAERAWARMLALFEQKLV